MSDRYIYLIICTGHDQTFALERGVRFPIKCLLLLRTVFNIRFSSLFAPMSSFTSMIWSKAFLSQPLFAGNRCWCYDQTLVFRKSGFVGLDHRWLSCSWSAMSRKAIYENLSSLLSTPKLSNFSITYNGNPLLQSPFMHPSLIFIGIASHPPLKFLCSCSTVLVVLGTSNDSSIVQVVWRRLRC